MIIRAIATMLSACLFVLGAAPVPAQNYPVRPIRIVTSGLGGSNDFIARLIASGISGPLGQNVIVENRASGVIPGETVSKAPPDGHTIVLTGSGLWIGQLFQSVPYDALRDFSPIILVSAEPNTLVVNPSLPVKSVKELIALAKAKPGELNYMSTGTGGSLHLAAELFKSMAGVNIVRVSYKSSSAGIADVMSGQVHMAIMGSAAAAPNVKSGKLRGLAVSGLRPSGPAPGLPPIAETLPGYEVVGVTAVLGPAATPRTITSRLNQEIARVISQPDFREKLLAAGQEIVGGPPDALANTMKSDVSTWSKLVKEAGLKAD